MTPRARKILLQVAKYALLAAVLWYVVAAMRSELGKVGPGEWAALKPNGLLMAAAGLCLVGVNSVQMLSYRALLRAYGATPSWPAMAAIAWIPPLGKYVPGKIWALLGAMAMLKRFGIGAAVAISVVLMLDAFSVIVGLIMSSPLLMRPPISTTYPWARWLGPVVIAAGLVSLAPPVFGRLLNVVLKLVKRPPLDRMPGWAEYATPIACSIAQWLFAGGALWLAARSITPVAVSAYPTFVMIAAGAMTISYLALIAPGGMGVREAIFLLSLPAVLGDAPTGTISIVIIAMRILQTIVEIALAGLGAWMLKIETRDRAQATVDPSSTV